MDIDKLYASGTIDIHRKFKHPLNPDPIQHHVRGDTVRDWKQLVEEWEKLVLAEWQQQQQQQQHPRVPLPHGNVNVDINWEALHADGRGLLGAHPPGYGNHAQLQHAYGSAYHHDHLAFRADAPAAAAGAMPGAGGCGGTRQGGGWSSEGRIVEGPPGFCSQRSGHGGWSSERGVVEGPPGFCSQRSGCSGWSSELERGVDEGPPGVQAQSDVVARMGGVHAQSDEPQGAGMHMGGMGAGMHMGGMGAGMHMGGSGKLKEVMGQVSNVNPKYLETFLDVHDDDHDVGEEERPIEQQDPCAGAAVELPAPVEEGELEDGELEDGEFPMEEGELEERDMPDRVHHEAQGAAGAGDDVKAQAQPDQGESANAAAPGESENELHHYDQALVVVAADPPDAAAGCGTDAAVDSANFLAAVTSLGEVTLPRSWTSEAPQGSKSDHQVEEPSMISAAAAETVARSYLAAATASLLAMDEGEVRGEGASSGGLITTSAMKKTRGRKRKSLPGKVARAADFAATAADPDPERHEGMAVLSLPADTTLINPAPLDPASLHSLSLWLSRYHAVRAPEPPTPASLDSILTDGPAVVRDVNDPGPDPAVGVRFSPAAGGSYYAQVEVPASLLPKPVRRRGRPRKQVQVEPPEMLHPGGCTSGYLAAARLHDALVMKMYLCGGRWSAERPVVLNFPPAQALEMLSAPRALEVEGFREFSDYLRREVGEATRRVEPVEGWRGVYRLLVPADVHPCTIILDDDSDDEGGTPAPAGAAAQGAAQAESYSGGSAVAGLMLMAGVFDRALREGKGARRWLTGTQAQGACCILAMARESKFWASPEHAARAYDREVIRLGYLLDPGCRLNYPLTDYEAEFAAAAGRAETVANLVEFAEKAGKSVDVVSNRKRSRGRGGGGGEKTAAGKPRVPAVSRRVTRSSVAKAGAAAS